LMVTKWAYWRHVRISRVQDGGSFQLNPLVIPDRLTILHWIITNQIRWYKQIAL
jgi:hypothetical protein